MKKVLFLLSFLAAFSLTTNAQTCHGGASKACCASKAAKAASADPSIEKRSDAAGMVSYVRKESDAQGNVKFVSVQFDEKANSFVNVAPPTATATIAADDKAGMVKKSASCAGEKKACCAKGAGKACCAKKAEGEAAPQN